MQQLVTIQGIVATTPRHLITQDGLPITSFRIASTTRKFDKEQNMYVDGETNWYTVSAFKALAINASNSLHKGERVNVAGKLRIRDWDNGERAGVSVEIEAETIGHDLAFGTSVFTRALSNGRNAEADQSHSCNCGGCNN